MNKSLKRATPRMKYVHMNHVMAFKEHLADHQAEERARKYQDEGMKICQDLRDLMTQAEYDAWWETAPENGFFEAAHARLLQLSVPPKHANYNHRNVPDRPCPKCGGLLIVRERRMPQRDREDFVTNFVGCANFETRGCSYTETFTHSTRAQIDAVVTSEEADF